MPATCAAIASAAAIPARGDAAPTSARSMPCAGAVVAVAVVAAVAAAVAVTVAVAVATAVAVAVAVAGVGPQVFPKHFFMSKTQLDNVEFLGSHVARFRR